MILVPNSKLRYRRSDKGGWEWSDDGVTWYFTFRTEEEIRAMHQIPDTPQSDTEDSERELFGETLDEPIPDHIWDMIRSD